MDTFKNLTQLLDYFKDEETCRAYYEQKRWGGNVACPHCGSLKVYRTNRGFKCGEKLCYKKFTVTTQTIFENTKIGLRIWFAAMYLISTAKKGVSSLQLAEQLGITQKSAWFVLHRIREMLKDDNSKHLEGEIEVDETYVGGKNKNRHKNKKVEHSQGRSAKDKTPVVGLIQRDGKVRLFVVSNTESETLHTIMGSNVAENSTVITDAYRAYNGLDSRYTHVTVKHEEGGYVIKIGDQKFHTNNIENFWSIFKRGIIGIYHFVSAKHLQRYCSEFGYRYNERELTGVQKFDTALTKVASARITYNTLTGKQ
ncbi:MAG TPA: IS1595 family transposase [Candidatus Dojkabacteria bacterium]|nr:IS1595 family transposase [Candidatus Dojkabacteria bacterium]